MLRACILSPKGLASLDFAFARGAPWQAGSLVPGHRFLADDVLKDRPAANR